MKSERVIIGLFFLMFLFFLGGYGVRCNVSESLPNRLYFSFPASNPQIGQIVTFTLPYSSVTFAKQIAGLSGDEIEIREQKIFINGCEKGKIVEKHKPIEEGIIPNGYCFMLGEHEKSFDSRYFEFGLVPNACIKEQLCPIF